MADLETIPENEDKELYRICMYLLTKSDYHSDRDIFIMADVYEALENKYIDSERTPAIMSSLTAVNYKAASDLSGEEIRVKVGSVLAANKSPETFTIIAAADEYDALNDVRVEKSYNVKIHKVTEILNLCGVDFPFRTIYHGQIRDFENRQSEDLS